MIGKFHNHELQPIRSDNRYHSPEVSETDDDNIKRKVVIRDLKWRSSTVSDEVLFSISNDRYFTDLSLFNSYANFCVNMLMKSTIARIHVGPEREYITIMNSH